MKKSITFTILLFLIAFVSSNANSIIGAWEVEQTGDITYIEKTVDGIRAKLGSQGPWYYYEKISKREFLDRRGNSYRIESYDHISWQSRDRRKEFDLWKVRYDHPDYRDNHRDYRSSYDDRHRNDYEKRNYYDQDWYEGKNDIHRSHKNYSGIQKRYWHRSKLAYYMEGKWTLRHSRVKLKIRTEDSRHIYVKFKDSYHGNKIFKQHKKHPNVFIDKHGHKLILKRNGKLIMDIPGYNRAVLKKIDW